MEMVARDSPLLDLIGPPHSPPLLEEVTAVGEGKTGGFKTGFVGKGGIVGVGCGVPVGAVVVGGMGVSAGMAAWVIANMVLAAATAEACTDAGSTVGVAFTPHALNINTRTAIVVNKDFDFMDFNLPFSCCYRL